MFNKRISPKSEEEISKIKESCTIVVKAIAHVAKIIKPGVTGLYLDREAETVIRDMGGIPAFKGYHGFPGSLCISINSAVVHGIPNEKELKEGDIVSIDCGAVLNDYFGDSAYTFALKPAAEEVIQLLKVTNESLYKGVAQAKVGNRIGDISFAVQEYTEVQHKYGVVRELVGHGIGKNLHEPPDVPNFGKKGNGLKLEENWTIAIEPMINLGRKDVYQAKDRWTILTKDNKPSAHFEHTVAVRSDGGEILSDHTEIEEEIKNNGNIVNISKNI
ncbi:MAG: type I methionyl aminopeptidase [Saprospiraceae bacterium]|jgi:methionyl aminopeptidase|nr:type I methionyl aminopeptidase [Saprospiraceae bacterium]HQU94589.1 type I methionyl aminopeptidase [Saprospiraceae bacterium]HQW94171.1 type I methionyl aminopeptidase [Saprospiraceae bacterium]